MKKEKLKRRNILIALVLLAALYLIYIFARYWDIAVEAFKKGWAGA